MGLVVGSGRRGANTIFRSLSDTKSEATNLLCSLPASQPASHEVNSHSYCPSTISPRGNRVANQSSTQPASQCYIKSASQTAMQTAPIHITSPPAPYSHPFSQSDNLSAIQSIPEPAFQYIIYQVVS